MAISTGRRKSAVCFLTLNISVTFWVSEPEVAFTVTGKTPGVAPTPALKVSTEVLWAFTTGVTGLLEKDAATPLGNPLTLRVTADLKP